MLLVSLSLIHCFILVSFIFDRNANPVLNDDPEVLDLTADDDLLNPDEFSEISDTELAPEEVPQPDSPKVVQKPVLRSVVYATTTDRYGKKKQIPRVPLKSCLSAHERVEQRIRYRKQQQQRSSISRIPSLLSIGSNPPIPKSEIFRLPGSRIPICFTCKRPGHYHKNCPSRSSANVNGDH